MNFEKAAEFVKGVPFTTDLRIMSQKAKPA
jgi:hypothetical protein